MASYKIQANPFPAKIYAIPFWDTRMSYQSDKEWRAHYYRYYRGKSCSTGQAQTFTHLCHLRKMKTASS